MRVLIHDTTQLRSGSSFALSATVHGFVLAWVSLAPLVPPARLSVYEREIRPYENKIVWYNLNERLPEIRPPQSDPRPPRARTRSSQTLVAGPAETQRPPQLIWTPAPEIEARQMLPAPNVVALAPAAGLLRDFRLPPELVRAQPAPAALPEAPQVANVELKPVPLLPPARPQPRPFTPRDVLRAPQPQPENLPAAPAIEARTSAAIPLPGTPALRPIRRFAAPAEEHARMSQPESLPSAPQIPAEVAAATLPVTRPAPLLREFAVQQKPVAVATATLAEAPAINDAPSQAALAIVGLFPAREVPVPKPESSQKAGFSTGPQPRTEGGDSRADTRQLTVPELLAHKESNDSQPKLLAVLEPPTSPANLNLAARSVQVTTAVGTVDPQVTRVTSAPDPRMSGRVIYQTAIQMPNISSYSGSWIVWFAEREPLPDQPVPAMRVPQPLRKVDPKYTPAALDEKVEGKVRLAAVIRKDGRVERVELLQHLDSRLDQSSLEALAKWAFEPALRNGVAIDVDAVFEIPFHIAPKTPK